MRKGEITKQLIIRKAAPVFNKLGYGGTSLSDLMVATGLEKGGIYRHFASKEELACEAFDYAFQSSYEAKCAALGELTSGLQKIEAFITNFAEIRPPVAGGCPVYNTAVEHDDGNEVLRKKAQQAYKFWVAELLTHIAQAKAEGALKKSVDAEGMATFIFTSLEGALIARNLMGQSSLLQKVCDELRRYLEGQKDLGSERRPHKGP